MFRDSDLEAMQSFFDLGSYDAVKENAEKIYERLTDGTMPCDEPWSEDKIAKFKAWMDAGTPA